MTIEYTGETGRTLFSTQARICATDPLAETTARVRDAALTAMSRRIMMDDNTNLGAMRPTWTSSSLDADNYLTEEAVTRYRALFEKLRALAGDDEDAIEQGAIDTATRTLLVMLQLKWTPPQLAWHGGDAVVFFWSVGDAVHAITVTEGELAYLERRGSMITRRVDSIPFDAGCLVPILRYAA